MEKNFIYLTEILNTLFFNFAPERMYIVCWCGDNEKKLSYIYKNSYRICYKRFQLLGTKEIFSKCFRYIFRGVHENL